jgi:hypothetical protein
MAEHKIFEEVKLGETSFLIRKFDCFSAVGLVARFANKLDPAFFREWNPDLLFQIITTFSEREFQDLLKTCMKQVWAKDINKPVYMNDDFIIQYEYIKYDIYLAIALLVQVIGVNYRGFFTGEFSQYLPAMQAVFQKN